MHNVEQILPLKVQFKEQTFMSIDYYHLLIIVSTNEHLCSSNVVTSK